MNNKIILSAIFVIIANLLAAGSAGTQSWTTETIEINKSESFVSKHCTDPVFTINGRDIREDIDKTINDGFASPFAKTQDRLNPSYPCNSSLNHNPNKSECVARVVYPPPLADHKGSVLRFKSEPQNLSQTTIGDPPLDKAAFIQKTQKLRIPFIANQGQVDEKVKFYAKTFGGTVFVTKNGEIVYALPNNSSEAGRGGITPPVQAEAGIQQCRGELHSPNHVGWVKGNAPNKENSKDGFATLNPSYVFDTNRVSDIVHPASWIVYLASDVYRESCIVNHVSDANPQSKTPSHSPNPQSTICNPKSEITGIALREEFVGARVKAIQGEDPSVTKVNYFKGNDPSKWKTDISTYDFVNLGEIYKGIELRLKAYGDNVEKLFCVKPGASPEKIQVQLNGAKSLKVNEDGQLVAETELGPVKFTKPVAYQEIGGKRVEVLVEYRIQDVGWVKHVLSFVEGRSAPNKNGLNDLNDFNGLNRWNDSDGFASLNPSYTDSKNPQSAIHNRYTASPSPPTIRPKTSSSTPCLPPRTWAGLLVIMVILSPSTQAGTYM